MSETTAQPDAEAVQTDDVEQTQTEPKTYEESYVKKLREEAAKYRVKLKEIEDAQKSELERATESAEAAQRELAATRAEAARLRVAAKHGIGEDLQEFLTGADEGEMEAQAVKLAALIEHKQQPVPNTWDRPEPKPLSVADRFASAFEGRI